MNKIINDRKIILFVTKFNGKKICNINDKNNKKIIPINPFSDTSKISLLLGKIKFEAIFPDITTIVTKNIKVNSISNIFIDKINFML